MKSSYTKNLSLFEVENITPVESDPIQKLSNNLLPLFTLICLRGIFELVLYIEILQICPDIIFFIECE